LVGAGEVAVGLVDQIEAGAGSSDVIFAIRTSDFTRQLATFVVDSSTGGSVTATKAQRMARQQAARLAIQNGQRPASYYGTTMQLQPENQSQGTLDTSNLEPRVQRKIEAMEDARFFIQTLSATEWETHEDGLTATISTEHLAAQMVEHYKRAPNSAFTLPAVNPGCGRL